MTLRRQYIGLATAVALCLVVACEAVRADWIILKDGRAGRVVQGSGPATQVEFPDGKRRDVERGEIAKRLTDKLFDREVDLLALGLGRDSSREASIRRLEQLGAAPVGRLLVRLKGRDKVMRMMALTALQFCWASDAREPVLAAAKDRDPTIRRLAMAVVRRHLDDALAKVLDSQISDPDPHVAGPAIRTAEEKGPDLDRMLAAMAKPGLWRYVHPYLGRYHSSKLTDLTHRMLDRGETDQKVSAICSLIHQQDNSAKTRQKIAALLRSPHADLRDMAGEYLRWHGTAAERPALADKLKSEADPYARASLAAAMDAIGRRAKRFKPGGQGDATPWPDKPADAYAAALKALTAAPNEATRQRVVALLAGAEPFEPFYRFEGRPKLRDTPTLGAARDATLMRLLNLAFGYPPPSELQKGNDAKAAAAVAKTLIGPVRRYLDPKRKSYGLRSRGSVDPFAGSTHIGDDVAWRKPHATVVAIGDGVVRRVQVGEITWGGLVVVEHTGPDDRRFCSLYAHLGPLVCVRSGQTVKKGQKLGSVGRAHTWAGGGYGSHLHFGIHTGSFSGRLKVGQVITVRLNSRPAKAKVVAVDAGSATLRIEGTGRTVRMPHGGSAGWIGGYISPESFKAGKHGWVDPQQFIKAHARQETPSSQSAVSRLKLARGYISAGLNQKAKAVLEEIVSGHPKSKEATEAKRLLKSIEAAKPK